MKKAREFAGLSFIDDSPFTSDGRRNSRRVGRHDSHDAAADNNRSSGSTDDSGRDEGANDDAGGGPDDAGAAR